MTSFLRYAWRNLWRNGKRSAITVAAVSLNTAVLVVTYALMRGLLYDMVRNATRLAAGDAQVHAPGWRADRSIYGAIPDPRAVVDAARRAGIEAATRSYGFGLVSCGSKSAGALFWGVDPAAEMAGFDLARSIERGSFLGEAPSREIVLGRKLAKSLDAEVGDEIVVVVQAADGSLGNEILVVAGVLEVAGDDIDRMAAIVHGADFDEIFVAGGRVHEVALTSMGRLSPEEVAAAVTGAAPGIEVQTWRQLMPQLANVLVVWDASIWIFDLIFLLAAGLGVMNTMLMATYERIREFGVMKALGATPWRIVKDVAGEALVLALVSTGIGALAGAAAAFHLQRSGLDLGAFVSGGISIAGIAFDPLWHASLSVEVVLAPVASMCATCLVASLYPAAKAARLDPVRAMAHA